jgi:hypothetical protein
MLSSSLFLVAFTVVIQINGGGSYMISLDDGSTSAVRFLGQGFISRPSVPCYSRHVSILPASPNHSGACVWAQVDTRANRKFALHQMATREVGLSGPVLLQRIKHNVGYRASCNVSKHSKVKFHLSERRFVFLTAVNVFEMH